jgi:uncharacterized protein (DUF4415 family)
MATQTKTIIDAATGDIKNVAMSEQDLAEQKELLDLHNEKLEAEIAEQAAKEAAEAKLAALGLTADDLKALGLGNN